MKKFLPLILLAVGALVFIGALVVVKGKKNTSTTSLDTEDEVVAEIPFAERPFTTLTPTSDGHWLYLNIGEVKVKAATIDYELLYKTKSGTTQGVPGTIKLDSGKIEERKLLLGSESSGKFRYDEGVEDGTLTLRFRSDKGKLLGKLSTDFHLQTGASVLTSKDGKFTFTLTKAAPKVYFVTMNTFGLPATTAKVAKEGPYGVFSSDKTVYAGKPTLGGGEVDSVDGMNVFFTAN